MRTPRQPEIHHASLFRIQGPCRAREARSERGEIQRDQHGGCPAARPSAIDVQFKGHVSFGDYSLQALGVLTHRQRRTFLPVRLLKLLLFAAFCLKLLEPSWRNVSFPARVVARIETLHVHSRLVANAVTACHVLCVHERRRNGVLAVRWGMPCRSATG